MLVACSLLTDLDGLAGAPAERLDGGTGDAVSDAAQADGAARDASGKPRAYLFGGAGGTPDDSGPGDVSHTTIFAPILADGTVGEWTSGPNLPSNAYRNGVVGIGDIVHVIGGYDAPASGGTATVFSSHILEGGAFGPFIVAPPLANLTSDTCPVVSGTRAYAIDPGLDGVQFATVTKDGFGAWSMATRSEQSSSAVL